MTTEVPLAAQHLPTPQTVWSRITASLFTVQGLVTAGSAAFGVGSIILSIVLGWTAMDGRIAATTARVDNEKADRLVLSSKNEERFKSIEKEIDDLPFMRSKIDTTRQLSEKVDDKVDKNREERRAENSDVMKAINELSTRVALIGQKVDELRDRERERGGIRKPTFQTVPQAPAVIPAAAPAKPIIRLAQAKPRRYRARRVPFLVALARSFQQRGRAPRRSAFLTAMRR